MIRTKRGKPISWTKEQSCKFIEELQRHPVLYDQMHPFYQHRSHRFQALRHLIAELKSVKPNISPDMIPKKLKALRHQYYQEKRRIENPPQNLIDMYGRYQPRLWCFDLLKFLDKRGKYPLDQPPALPKRKEQEPQAKKNEKVEEDSIIEESNEFNDSNDPFEEIEIERVDHHRKPETENRSQTHSVLHTKCLQLIDTLSKGISSVKAHTENDATGSIQTSPKTFLGLMVESELSRVSEDIYHDAKWRIIRILEEATTKEQKKKIRNGQINLESTLASTSSQNLYYDLDNGVFKASAHTPIYSTVKVMEVINASNQIK